jgi:ABC-type Mn2+/Zn2+ transport system ATPase subunit
VSDGALVVDRLGVRFGAVVALDGVSFRIGWGELVGIVGPNGAGKSTLFRAVSGLVAHTGAVSVGGRRCHHHRDRASIGMVPQRSNFDPDFPITVGELVASGRRRFRRTGQRPRRSDRLAVDDALAQVGLADRSDHPVGVLSGGQFQRAMIARALAQGSDVLLLDEALAGVDAPSTESLFDLFDVLIATGSTIVVTTHDLALARRRFARCLCLNGTLVADGAPVDVLRRDVLDVTYGSRTTALATVDAG